MFKWIINVIWEKINLPKVYREIKVLGKKHGKRFFWAALIWEFIEDVVFPFVAWLCGVPELIPIFLVLHFEPIVYPAFFWGFRMWDRAHGKEPWEPDRSAQSAYWRSAIKVLIFQLVVSGWISHFIPLTTLAIFTVLIGLFSFIHERIWHDINYGILQDDSVQLKRAAAKTGTYLLVSTITLYPLLKVAKVPNICMTLMMAQLMTVALYLILEAIWAKSLWGVRVTKVSIMNNQEVFYKVKNHLLTQMKKSIDSEGFCLYRGPDGLKCALGCLIPDEDYHPSMEGKFISGPHMVPILEKLGIQDTPFLYRLQKVHDINAVADWEFALKRIAEQEGLSYE